MSKQDYEAKKSREQQAAKELLDKADEILNEVREGIVLTNLTPREFPTFERSEIGLAKVLGVGGFCVVKEIRGIRLKQKHLTTGKTINGEAHANHEEDDEAHLEVSTARHFIAKHFLRNGDARYAVKRLHKGLDQRTEARGIIDLAIEARLFTVISHPNIVKMRALAEGNPIRRDYFIVLDRLYGTLEERMTEWKITKKKHKGFMKIGTNKQELEDLMVEQLTVAYDLSSAFRYLHSLKLVYRDIKPDNIGFDIRGDVKVFDFGLCKCLNPKLKVGDGMFKLTGRTGSRPYMAPEVHLCKPYNASADVYSFGMLLWEILALKHPFEALTNTEFRDKVIRGGSRPKLSASWPALTQKMLSECWSERPKDRPGFKRIASIIRGDLVSIAKDNEAIVNRTVHMMDRSARSQRNLFGRRRRSTSIG